MDNSLKWLLGNSHWYLKGTNAGEPPEIAAAMVKCRQS